MRIANNNHDVILRLFDSHKQERIRDMNARIMQEHGISPRNPNASVNHGLLLQKGQAGLLRNMSWDDQASLANPNHIRGLSIVQGQSFDNRIIDLPDHMREAMITIAREDFATNFGSSRSSARSAERETMLMHSFLREMPEQDRQAALWTMQQTRLAEMNRIHNSVRQAMPNWTSGVRVPDEILRPILNGAGGFNAQA